MTNNELKQEVIKEIQQQFGLIPGFFSEDKAAGAIFLNKGNYESSVWMEGEGLFYMDDVAWEELPITNAVQDGDTPVKLRRHGNWVHITGAVRSVENRQVIARITPDIAPVQDSYFAANAFLSKDVNLPVAATVVVGKDGKISTYLPEATTHYVSFSLSYPIK
ncbi:hypothetical protein [Bacillus pseudomycoides]|uniref:hypothetical protein n=1 Tax=Bacillus pseudomycoides TaxID=64104 RepID=UPI000BED387F|nr:hypothetical protein [Bacillus pseudomycoides]PED05253.1 hypothetical protein COO19_27355 [Bacillus pseudomycoides]PEK14734.1 hypothetical protein CN693_23675 [Bacillus pseudomycoides]PEO23197.1 hypothetical protein CN542_02835 [Bacillus pseudomycoides]PEP58518.1 hypothetical protein CN591_22885 [Bacillus pseudomycoides]PFW69786.1 hypothetical protein COL25_06775 [Bacillus pseudomycoides]